MLQWWEDTQDNGFGKKENKQTKLSKPLHLSISNYVRLIPVVYSSYAWLVKIQIGTIWKQLAMYTFKILKLFRKIIPLYSSTTTSQILYWGDSEIRKTTYNNQVGYWCFCIVKSVKLTEWLQRNLFNRTLLHNVDYETIRV